MRYRYFAKPHAFSTYKFEKSFCDLCGRSRTGYKGGFRGRVHIEFVCEECLAAGKLRLRGAFTNEGDIRALREQLKTMFPEYGETQLRFLERRRTDELEHRTPHILTWQDFQWPAHCGDYCCFIKEVGLEDLDRLAADGNGRQFFEEHLHNDNRRGTELDNWWYGIRPDSPEDNSVAYNVGVYLFQCLLCAKYVILWDAS